MDPDLVIVPADTNLWVRQLFLSTSTEQGGELHRRGRPRLNASGMEGINTCTDGTMVLATFFAKRTSAKGLQSF